MAESWRGNPSYTITTHVDGLMDISENFDSNDNLIASSSMRDASNTAGSGYDSLNRPVAQRDSRTGVSTTAYLSTTADLVASVTATDSTTTAFTYDIRGRRTAVDAPDAGGHDNITYTSYYPTGQVKATWGDQAYPRYHVYDGQNRLIALHTYNTAPTGEPTGEPTGSGSSVTTWVYNTQRGWLDRKQYNDGKGTDYTFTDAGRLATRAWAREITTGTPVTTTYGYTAGRLTSVSYNDSITPAVSYSYDCLGRVLNADNTVSTNTYAYNANLTLATETVTTGGITRTLDRSYDTLLRPSGMTVSVMSPPPAQPQIEHGVNYTYDPAGRHATVTGGAINGNPGSEFTYAYQPNSYGLVQSVTGPAHTVTNAWETDRNVLDTKTNADLSSTPVTVSAYDYTVNNIGQRESLATSGSAFNGDFRTLDWDYDALGQVIAEADSGATPDSRAFEFDAIGNRKKSADSLTLPTSDNYVANALNQYTTVELASSQLAPSYDDDGNLTDDAGVNNRSSFAARTYIWDAENRLIEVKEGTSTIAEYAYDYLGRRVRKTVTDGTNDEDTVFLYDGWNVIAEYDVTSTPALDTTYTWGMDLSGSMQGAGGVGGLLAVNDGTDTYYPTYDGNGNVSEYLNASGADIAHYEYDAFGNIVKATGNSEDFRYRFSTKPLDTEIGWYYYGYRYYDPLTGRWPSRDPIGEDGGYNLYGFVNNNSISNWDTMGLWFADGVQHGSYVDEDGNTQKDGHGVVLDSKGGLRINMIGGSNEWQELHEETHIVQLSGGVDPRGSDVEKDEIITVGPVKDWNAIPYKQHFRCCEEDDHGNPKIPYKFGWCYYKNVGTRDVPKFRKFMDDNNTQMEWGDGTGVWPSTSYEIASHEVPVTRWEKRVSKQNIDNLQGQLDVFVPMLPNEAKNNMKISPVWDEYKKAYVKEKKRYSDNKWTWAWRDEEKVYKDFK